LEIFVGNLSFNANESDVKKLFEGLGDVASVVIVMEKEKKAPKSRGFGFVQMPDEQQALVAIAALNGKEFMGRLLNVNVARPKTETERKIEPKKKIEPKVKVEVDRPMRPFFAQPGAYKGGRRTHSYIKRRGLAGIQKEVMPQGRPDNPMRWRKRADDSRPWQKSPGEYKPWKRTEGGAGAPWKRAEGESRPWRKSEGGVKPWKRAEGGARPPWKKAEGESKPWRRSEGGIKPWKKPAGDVKPWRKTSAHAPKSGFSSPSASFGTGRGDVKRGRAKGRSNPGGYKR